MRIHGRHQEDEDIRMNIAPLIDIVFLLIIFFMVVNQMSQIEEAELTLPYAPTARPPENPDPGRIKINIMENGEIEVLGATWDDARLQKELWVLAQRTREMGVDPEASAANKTILLRADGDTEYRHVQKVMQTMTRKDIRLFRLSFATSDKEEEKKE